jgi:arylsulfatase
LAGLVLVASSGAALASCEAAAETAVSRGLSDTLPVTPGLNVLVVSFDALRADHLGLYGYGRRTSPHIDAFGRSAVVFSDSWAASSATPTSFAGIFTARLPPQVFQDWKLLDHPTLAGHFAARGYDTAMVTSNVQLVAARGFDRGFRHYDVATRGSAGIADDEELLRRAAAWLRASGRPFFLWVHFLSPHAPYDVREGSAHLYRAGTSLRFAATSGALFAAADDAERARLVDLYDGEVFFADRLFGKTLATLAELGVESETLVVLTSDHGEAIGEHGNMQHQGVHAEVLRIPLVVRHPRGPAGGRRVALPVSHLDLAPTLAAIAGLPPFPSAHGASLLEPIDPRRPRIAVAMSDPANQSLAISRGTEKLIVSCREKRRQLFELGADPGETRDLAAERRRQSGVLAAELRARVGGDPCRVVAEAYAGLGPGQGLTAEQVRQLEALGYLGGAPPSATAKRRGAVDRLWASPNPILGCRAAGVGATTLHWRIGSPAAAVEIRVLPQGKVFARGGRTGSATTGPWVHDGMRFVAIDTASGDVLATLEARLAGERCGPPS